MKATHNGTCQACGAVQALPNGSLSKHGYNVQWGFFSGVCTGAERAPMEQDTSFALKVIADLTEQAETLNGLTVADITKVPVRVRENGVRVENLVCREAFLAMEDHQYQTLKDRDPALWETVRECAWDRAQGAVVANSKWRAKSMLQHADHLQALIESRHGEDLIPREKPADLERLTEYFLTTGQAYGRAKVLTAKGWKCRVSRRNGVTLNATRAK